MSGENSYPPQKINKYLHKYINQLTLDIYTDGSRLTGLEFKRSRATPKALCSSTAYTIVHAHIQRTPHQHQTVVQCFDVFNHVLAYTDSSTQLSNSPQTPQIPFSSKLSCVLFFVEL